MIEDEVRSKKKRLKAILRKEWELFSFYEKNILYKEEIDKLVIFLVDLKEFNITEKNKIENYKNSKLVLNKTNYKDYEYNANRNYIGDIFKESTEKDLGNLLIKLLEKIGYKNIEFSGMGRITFEENEKDTFLKTILNMFDLIYALRIRTIFFNSKNEDLNKEFYKNFYKLLKYMISNFTKIDVKDIEIDLSYELEKVKNNEYNKELLKSSIMLKKYKNYTFTIKKKIEDEKINSEIVFKSFIFFLMEIWITSEFKFYLKLLETIDTNKEGLDINMLSKNEFLDKLKKIKKPYSLNSLMKIFRIYQKNERDSEFKKRYKLLECYINYFFDTEVPEIIDALVHNNKVDRKDLEKILIYSFSEDEKIYGIYHYYVIFYIINPTLEKSRKRISNFLNIFCTNSIFVKVLDLVNYPYTSLIQIFKDYEKLKKIYNEYYNVLLKKKMEWIIKENIKLNNFMLHINKFSENKEDKIRTFLEENYLEFKDKKNEAIRKKQSPIYLELLFYAMFRYFDSEEKEKYLILIKEIADNFSKKYLYTRDNSIPYLIPPEIDKLVSSYSIFLNYEESTKDYIYYIKNIYNFLIFISDSGYHTLLYLENKLKI